ncbi:hypothetical protein DNK47_03000 [Mycoplasma wenyonii]|uniref:Uncharacterized protein n=1 Tax=Mycoplasma wenyonii TaxID=65123 RepID=A0A328PTL5_9MOLU|nr:hypothetical protein [Mycoplasma wenyonii]RAO94811.1 hypothetical protein DNK47_03000 [Mycoplasma wenyonii]
MNQNNPFSAFYEDKKKFQEDLESVNSKEQIAEQQLAEIRRERRLWSGWTARHSEHFDSLERQLSETKDNSSGSIQLRVGFKLLEWMGQLSK